ncbi:protein kinase [Actinoplanes bogorensis]|uniref:Protein kinase n=1 Tax=Paractinoplanes bogorensis TaxID=1610840 RepID=A0ABS5YRB1_9ACTN|nr:serine/threonine-protein kinase [Actinoplanes bogorensis]MBU2665990.1 protein kinase [Actinoplanes bogorensis]
MTGGWTTGEIVLGQYQVLGDPLAGGMGVVHRVRHLGWEVDLAVKTPKSSASFARFEAEAGTWVGLGLHPHTVNCVYVRTIDGVPRVFAEWVGGGTLAEAIRGGRLGEAAKLDLAVQTAWGLRHAHDSGLVHQDMKPANVMLEPDGTAKVTDFGLAVAATEGTFGGLTPAYCSPEQAAAAAGDRGVRLTPATDVWSWAITVAEMFAGRRITRFGQAAAEALAGVRADLPPSIFDLLARCFAERPDGFGELVEQLISLSDEPYPRPATLRSDGLSNQALSLLDLGRADEAEHLWRTAITADPHHLPSVYNFGLHRWRTGQVTGEEVVSALEVARAAAGDGPEPGRAALLLGSVELERHEDDRAGELLREAAEADPSSAEAVAALRERARRAPRISAGVLVDRLREMVAGPDGDCVLYAIHGGGLYLWKPAEDEPRELARGVKVTAIASGGAGRIAAVLREDGSITLWDVPGGVPREGARTSPGALSVAVSDDGRFLAAGHRDGHIRIWELGAPGEPVVLTGHAGQVTALALSRTGRRALSGSFGVHDVNFDGDGTVRHWRVSTGECVAVWGGPRRGTRATGEPWTHFPGDRVALSADARCAVAAWQDGPLALWDARRATVVGEGSHGLQYERVMELAPGARGLLIGGPGRRAQIVDPRDGHSVRVFDDDLPQELYGVDAGAFSRDGRVLAIGGADHIVLRAVPGSAYQAPWCYVRPRPVLELQGAQESFADLLAQARERFQAEQYAEAATLLRTAGAVPGYHRHPEVLGGWRSLLPYGRRAALLAAWELFHMDGQGVFTQPPTVALRGDGLVMATGRWIGDVVLWEFPVAQVVDTFQRDPGVSYGNIREIRWARGGNLLVVHTWGGFLRFLDVRDGRSDDLGGDITAFDVEPSGDRILFGDKSGTMRLLGLQSGVRLFTIHAVGSGIGAVALSPDCTRMVCADESGEVRMWRANTRRPDWTMRTRFPGGTRLHFSPDNRTVLVDELTGLTGLDAGRGKKLFEFPSRRSSSSGQTNVSFSADRRLAATPDASGLIVWDTSTGRKRHELALPGAPVEFVLGPDGTFAVVGSEADTVGIWDLATGRCLQTLEGHRARMHRLRLSDDGTRLVTIDLRGGLRAWELAWEADLD